MERAQVQDVQLVSQARKVYLWIFVTGVFSVVITIVSYLFGTVDRNSVFTSDTMYLPMLFDDLVRHGDSFFSWYLTPAPGFFPDMLLFFVSRIFVNNTLLNFAVFAAFQVILSYLVSLMMIHAYDKQQSIRLARSLVFGTFFLAAISIFAFRGLVPYVHIFLPVFRFGSIFNTLILTTCIFWAFNTRLGLAEIGIGLICLLATATDIMILPMAVIPAISSIILVTWMSRTFSKSSGILLLSVIVSCSFMGWLVKESTTKNTFSHYIGLAHTSFADQFKLLIQLIYEGFGQNVLLAGIVLGFYLLVGLNLFSRLKLFREQPRAANSDKELYILIFLVISPLITCATVLLNGILTGDIHELRYISNFFWLPIFFSWVALRPSWMQKRGLQFALIGLMSYIVLSLFSMPISSFGMDYYPPLVQCIDGAVSEYARQADEQIDEGLSFYWEAKLVTHFSRKNLSVLQYLQDKEGEVHPFLWIINKGWYTDQVYDFAVLAHDDSAFPYLPFKERIVSLNGEPKATKFCSLTDLIRQQTPRTPSQAKLVRMYQS